MNHYLQLHPQPSLSAYADFFSLLSILDSRIRHGLQASSTGQRSISQSQKNINEVMAFINRHLTEPLTLESIAAEMICEQLYDLAKLQHAPLSADAMTKFVARSNDIMMLLTK